MSLEYQILGGPGRDNALFVRIDSGQSIERVLFDCGEGCVGHLENDDARGLDRVVFSHFHMDHVAGFDSLFRANFDRDSKPMHIIGPPDTIRVMEHRLRGWLWNLHDQMSSTWYVTEVSGESQRTVRLELREAFAVSHPESAFPAEPRIAEGTGYTLQGILLDHKTPVLGAVLREKPRHNIDTARLASLGLRPGPWLKEVKDAAPAVPVEVQGTVRAAGEWRELLVVETPGDSIAYLTDFLLDESALERLPELLRGVRTLVCECQYLHEDLALAQTHHHLTSVHAATLAMRAGVEQLILFHLTTRYQPDQWRRQLAEARAVFPAADFPTHWRRLRE